NTHQTRQELLAYYAASVVAADTSEICRFGNAGRVLAVALRQSDTIAAVAMVDMGEDAGGSDDADVRWAQEFLVTAAEDFKMAEKSARQIEIVSSELAQTYEELVLLYKMSTSMKITESDSNYLQMACDSLTDLVNVEGIAILLERQVGSEKHLVLTAGSGLIDIDQRMSDILYDRLVEEVRCGKDALLDSEVDAPFRYTWPERIKNIIAVPLYGNEKIGGVMVAINRLDKSDFDSIDVKLFNSVANECAVFVENGKLFTDLKDLFVGSLKALTSSIDAKDQYTRGHSERVAFISRWLAERYAEREPLEDDAIHRIYLAGLLHDIGKIGIDEAVLRKNGKLSEEEFTQIKQHPLIGANILADIKQMKDIVPGVLCHHERVDGKGYPNSLVGKQIPLIGKIIMLADSFDAMTSKRVYRDAMDIDRAFAEIEKGLGRQFDEKIGRLFLDSDRRQLWRILQDGDVEDTGKFGFSEYGKLAVGTLLR
ncbi:MAG: HD domain-containing protein, partial [Sedimentisphaerales bacterium]|nr:HD domain-containing protein [Sedimentisphaerales bacterium]